MMGGDGETGGGIAEGHSRRGRGGMSRGTLA